MGEAAFEAAAALDAAEASRDVEELDDALRRWAAVTGQGGAVIFPREVDRVNASVGGGRIARSSSSTRGQEDGDDSSSHLPSIGDAKRHEERRTASAPDGQNRSRGGYASAADRRRNLLPLEALQAGIITGDGARGHGRLARLHALAKEVRTAESRAAWERRAAEVFSHEKKAAEARRGAGGGGAEPLLF